MIESTWKIYECDDIREDKLHHLPSRQWYEGQDTSKYDRHPTLRWAWFAIYLNSSGKRCSVQVSSSYTEALPNEKLPHILSQVIINKGRGLLYEGISKVAALEAMQIIEDNMNTIFNDLESKLNEFFLKKSSG